MRGPIVGNEGMHTDTNGRTMRLRHIAIEDVYADIRGLLRRKVEWFRVFIDKLELMYVHDVCELTRS